MFGSPESCVQRCVGLCPQTSISSYVCTYFHIHTCRGMLGAHMRTDVRAVSVAMCTNYRCVGMQALCAWIYVGGCVPRSGRQMYVHAWHKNTCAWAREVGGCAWTGAAGAPCKDTGGWRVYGPCVCTAACPGRRQACRPVRPELPLSSPLCSSTAGGRVGSWLLGLGVWAPP